MAVFPPLPLGQRIPASAHAVSCSLPTMHAVRGYEEKNPEVTRHMTSGYPRFVVHPFLQHLAAHLTQKHALTGQTLWLVTSRQMGDRLALHLGAAHVVRIDDGAIHGVAHPDSTELKARAKTFLQNTGGFLSSREAEDELAARGLLPSIQPETLFPGDAKAEVIRHLGDAFPGIPAANFQIASCGMNAIDTAFRAISEIQRGRGRTIWVQLGWLYLDTITLLKKHSSTPADYVAIRDVFDLAAIEQLFAEKGDRIAGLIAEVPTNPLLQTPDVATIAALAHRHGVAVVLDPSISSPFAVNVLRHADIVVTSLTKYAASAGDLTAGLVVVNPAAADASLLLRSVGAKVEPLYRRDLARLAVEIKDTHAVLAQIQASVPRVVEFLSRHPAVKNVFWALHANSRENYLRVARHPGAVGSMITFTLHGELEKFYDRLRLPKGPSFGITNVDLSVHVSGALRSRHHAGRSRRVGIVWHHAGVASDVDRHGARRGDHRRARGSVVVNDSAQTTQRRRS